MLRVGIDGNASPDHGETPRDCGSQGRDSIRTFLTSAPIAAPRLNPVALLALQRAAGNTATAKLVQRQRVPAARGRSDASRPGSSESRISALELRQRELETRQAAEAKRGVATRLDALWRARFGERLASYQQAIYRISNAINTASLGFQQAQSAQAQTEAMKIQAWGLVMSVAAAGLLQPLATAGLGALGQRFQQLRLTTEGVERIVELGENPAVGLIGGLVTNIRGTAQAAAASREAGQVPQVQPAGSPHATASSPPDAISF